MKLSSLLGCLLIGGANAVSMFSFDISCNRTTPASNTTCNHMALSLESAGLRISKILTITVPINVTVTLVSFGVGSENTIGYCILLPSLLSRYATASSVWFGRTDPDRPFGTYVQALVKQLAPTGSYSDYDIAASFNTDYDFFYTSTGLAITDGQIDFEFIALHELTHGLGFADDFLTTFSQTDTSPDDPSILIPIFAVDGNSTFQFYYPPSVFNTYLWDSVKQSMIYDYYLGVVNNFEPVGQDCAGLDFALSQNTVADTAAKAALDASLSGGLKFISEYHDEPISIFSPDPFQYGSSNSHLDPNTYFNTSDFLMRVCVCGYGGSDLRSILNATNYMNGSIYGPAELAIMTSIGWQTSLSTGNSTWYAYNYTEAPGSVPEYKSPTPTTPSATDGYSLMTVSVFATM